jgi:DNA-binding CsgD family transcriptional regulator
VELIGRQAECAVLDRLVEGVCAGESQALVIHGEPGVGKSALLDYLAERASKFGVMRAAGVQSEMELAFAAVHQLLAPLLDRLDRVPGPQREALRTAFGLVAGPPPDRFFIGLAVLSLLSEVADDRPLFCLIDDEQWLDQASAQALAFLARRLAAEPVGLVFAARAPGNELATLPRLVVRGLPDADARALLDAVLPGQLDSQVRDQIVAETRGNPLALVELPRDLTAEQLAGGFGLPSAVRVAGSVEESFRRRIHAMPDPTRELLLLTAAEPTGDPALIWRAAEQLGIGARATAPAIDAGLVKFGLRTSFRHPLARSAAYHSAALQQRQRIHRALANATDPETDPDRRAWHLAQAAAMPDEQVAAELERSAGRARGRGGVAAAAAFLQRAADLTIDPAQRAQRALEAASAKAEAGLFDAALDLIARAEAGPLSDMQHARIDLVRAQLAFSTNLGSDAPPLLLRAANRLESIDPVLSRATYLQALSAAIFAARLAQGCGVVEVSQAARDFLARGPRPPNPSLSDLLLDGFVTRYTEGFAAGVPILRRAVRKALKSPGEDLHHIWLASVAAGDLWDDESWELLSALHVENARRGGVLAELQLALTSRSSMFQFWGELTAAESLIQELQTTSEAAGGGGLAPASAVLQAAYRGDLAEVSALIEIIDAHSKGIGQGISLSVSDRAEAIVNNGVGDYRAATAAGLRATEHPRDVCTTPWSMAELVVAAARSGAPDAAALGLDRLSEMTSASGTDWGLGVEALCRAAVSVGAEAESRYREAIERLGRTRMRSDLARAHLMYGEWLQREQRRTDARDQLRVAHGMLDAMGMEAFAERARRELQATGETVRKRSADVNREQLTSQETQIARMARDGLSNPEIGARLFISARTVQYHLRKVFAKLDITSRSQLDRVLAGDRPREFRSDVTRTPRAELN